MLDFKLLKEMSDIRKSKALEKIAKNGMTEMYNYLSGDAVNTTFTAQNVKYIMDLHGDIDWNKITDKTNAMFNIGYSDMGNIIGILTNTNSILQDMLCYCSIEDARKTLKNVFAIDIGTKAIPGNRYAINNESPLTFGIPVITKRGYRTIAIVINQLHAKRFVDILETLDVEALNEEDMYLIAKDLEFISRTQELAIDVAKDKSIEIVDTSKWLMPGIKDKNHWVSKSKKTDDWLAIDNLNVMLKSKKDKKSVPDFLITKNVPLKIQSKIHYEVTTSITLASEAILNAGVDFFNKEYKELLSYTKETDLSAQAKKYATQYPNFSEAIKFILKTYLSYSIDNSPKILDEGNIDLNIYLRKIAKKKINEFARLCRNTIYHLSKPLEMDIYLIAMITYGTDLLHVSKDEGKNFISIMPEEFKKLYLQDNKLVVKEPLFFVDEDIKDRIEDGETITVDFVNGKAYENNKLIAKGSYKYNETNATISIENNTNFWYSCSNKEIKISEIGQDVIIPIENINDDEVDFVNTVNPEVTYVPVTINDSNIMQGSIVSGNISSKGYLSTYYKLMLINKMNLINYFKKNGTENTEKILKSPNIVATNSFTNTIKINNIYEINKDNEIYRRKYAVVNL